MSSRLSLHYVKPAVTKYSWFPPTACWNLSSEHPAPSVAVLTAGSLLACTPSTLTLAFPSLALQPLHPVAPPLCSHCSHPGSGQGHTSKPPPPPGRPLPSSWPLSSLPGIRLPEADIKNPLFAISGLHTPEPYPPADTCLTQKCPLLWIFRWTLQGFSENSVCKTLI